MGISVAPQPCQQLESLFCMFVLAILIKLLWHHSVVFNLHFPNNNVKHLFMFLFAIPIFSLMKCHCKSFAHFFKDWVYSFHITAFWEYLCKLDTSLSSHMWFQKFLPVHSLCLLILLAVSHIGQKSSFQCNSIYQSFFFPTRDCASHIISKKCLLNPRSQMFSPMFSSSL